MGTRCLTVMNDSDGNEIAVLYRQFDGYPEGHGADLKDFLSPFAIVNGIHSGETRKIANGAGCLAAQIVVHFKGEEAGNIYLYPAGTRDCGEEYVYTLQPNGENINLTVQAGMMTFFGMPGTPQAEMQLLYDGDITKFDPNNCNEKEA